MEKLKTIWTSKYFFGNKISEYGLQNGYVDYGTLGKTFNRVLNNNIIHNTQDIGYWDVVNGIEYDDENDTYFNIFQYYIINEQGAEILQNFTDEIVYYNDTLDMYVWGVTHWGTSWDYVLTDIKLELNK